MLYSQSLTVSIQDCSVCWDTSKHMVIYEQLNSFLEAKDVFKGIYVLSTSYVSIPSIRRKTFLRFHCFFDQDSPKSIFDFSYHEKFVEIHLFEIY